MNTAKDIRDKCARDIMELQILCNHASSHIAEEHWAVGHSTGRYLRVCDICEKVLVENVGV